MAGFSEESFDWSFSYQLTHVSRYSGAGKP